MAKPEWGMKRHCASCGAAFYDLKKDPIVCPKCGVTFQPDAVLKPRRPKAEEKPVVPKKAVVKKAAVGEDADEELIDEDVTDDELLDDAADLEDDDDVAEVIDPPDDKDPGEA